MAIRVTFECGHASMLRVRTTPQGYTHDWEVFVRGIDNADISQYVDKVVFHLHETFPKPKRTLKEPPYVVKESGYAGFVIPIDVYLKNKDEPRRIQISYDLILLPSGPAFNNVIRHHEVFANPSEEFRKKLLKGGGIAVSNSEDPGEKGDLKMVPPMVSKPKLSGTEAKKHRTTDLRTSNSFADLFGNPMTLPAKVSPESKRAQGEKVAVPKGALEKVEKLEKPTKVKHSPHKDKKKDKSVEAERKEKKEKGSSKEKERGKEKSKRAPSPGGNKEELYGSGNKKAAHESPPKKALLVPPASGPQQQKSPSPKPKEKEHKKTHPEKEKDRIKVENFKMPVEERKVDRKKKKHKDEKSKERREREKDQEKTKDGSKKAEKKIAKPEKHEGPEKEKSVERKVTKEEKKSPKHQRDKDKVRSEKSERSETAEKAKEPRTDKDKQKHKHKKKDKKERNEESVEKEKPEKVKLDKKSCSYSTGSPTPDPLLDLLAERAGDSSDSTHSLDEDSQPVSKLFSGSKAEPETLPPVSESSKAASPPRDSRPETDERTKREKVKNARSEERKRKRKLEAGQQQEEHSSKRTKDREHSVSPSVEPVSSSQSPISSDLDTRYNFKDTGGPLSQNQENDPAESEQVAPDSTNNSFIEPEAETHPAQQVFSDDYVTQLKELQQKIMTLQDNQELQRVVQVIAETGQYEITKKTFDFDLCALDRRTVLRLQQFFSTS